MPGVRLDPETERRIRALARARGCSKSEIVREAIRRYLSTEAFLDEARRQSLRVSADEADEAAEFAAHAADWGAGA